MHMVHQSEVTKTSRGMNAQPARSVLKVVGLAIWRERRLVWTLGGVWSHFTTGWKAYNRPKFAPET